MEQTMTHEIFLDEDEQKIENEIHAFSPLSGQEKNRIEGLIDRENEKKSISLRLKKYDLEKLKERAHQEGIPYQTLISSLLHKFVTDQLVDKRSLINGMQLLKNGHMH